MYMRCMATYMYTFLNYLYIYTYTCIHAITPVGLISIIDMKSLFVKFYFIYLQHFPYIYYIYAKK
jgi:hypothetical protein